jgi:hypothetical protein
LGASSRAVDGLGPNARTCRSFASFFVHSMRAAQHSIRRERPSSGPFPFARLGLSVRMA